PVAARSSPSLPAITGSQPALRPVRGARGPSVRRLALSLKIFIGVLIIWAVLTGVLTYEVERPGLDPLHAIVGALAGLAVAAAVTFGLKQVANRVQRLNRSALEISRGDLSKTFPHERPSVIGADEVDELSVAI